MIVSLGTHRASDASGSLRSRGGRVVVDGAVLGNDLGDAEGHGVLVRVEELELITLSSKMSSRPDHELKQGQYLNLERVENLVLVEGRRRQVGRLVGVTKQAGKDETDRGACKRNDSNDSILKSFRYSNILF